MRKITYIDIYGFGNLYYEVYKNGKRTIYAPSKDLKSVQRYLLNHIKTEYKMKLSIKDCAKVHCNQKWILKLDIRKFYESVPKYLIKDVIEEIDKKIITFMSVEDFYYLTTVGDKLPTGAVTSSYLANFAFSKTGIDDKLLEFCCRHFINYSRYMDDMFFSCDNKNDLKKVEKLAIKLLKEAGFNINHEKTQYISDNKKQEILGLVVNNKENCVISGDKKHFYRSMFFNYLKAIYLEERLGINSLFKKRVGFKEISGYLAHIKATDSGFYEITKRFLKSKIHKFGIYNNDEIKKLRKIIK